MSRLSFPTKLFLGFAVCSYGWTVLLDFAPHIWRPSPILVFLLCPACLLTITVDPSLTTVAFVLAPINAFVYGLFGFVLGKVLLKASDSRLERAKRVSAVVLGLTAVLIGGLLCVVVLWSAVKAGHPRLLLNGIFPCWAVIMGIRGLRYGMQLKS